MDSIEIGANEANQRLDRFLRKYLKDSSLSEIYKMLRKKTIRVNGKKAPENYRLAEGDTVEIHIDTKMEAPGLIKEAGRDFSIVYEDDNILIADKPVELILHPDARHRENTLVDQVLYYLYQSGQYNPEDEKTFRPAAVNRLDLNTGGLVLFAKNYKSLQDLNEIIREKLMAKYYICVVKGEVEEEFDIKAYLIKDEKNNKVSISRDNVEGSKEIHTIVKPLASSGLYSLLEINLITGRSHQIRGQLSALGHPIIGDMKYGDKKENRYFKYAFNLENQLLYAYKVYFNDAYGNLAYLKGRTITSPLPEKYTKIIAEKFDPEANHC